MANLHQLLKAMVEKEASDLHITTGSPPQLRIDGKLVPLKTAPLTPVETKQLCYSILKIARNATELLYSNMMATFLEVVKEKFKNWFLIIDSPPCQIMAETKSMAQRVDGIILVVMAGKTPRKDLEKAIENLGNEKILGVVFNGHEKALKNYYRYYDQYSKGK